MMCVSHPPLRRVRGAALLLSALLPAAALAQPGTLRSVRIATGIPQPTWVGSPRQDENRLFVLEKGINGVANIRIIDLDTHTVRPEPFLTVSGLRVTIEGGLLGLAFHPDFANNGYFWIHCTRATGEVQIVRYHVPGDPLTATAADPDSATPVLSVPGHTSVHHGGWMDFDLAGNLMIAVGDSGGGNRAIDLNDLSGKILRIDVDGPDNIPGNADDDGFPDDPERHYTIPANNPFVGIPGEDEIWSYGHRNPWRNELDPLTGNLYVAVVGDGEWEEINYEPATAPDAFPGDDGYYGGRHYGWPCYEGVVPHLPELCPDPDALTFPFLVYGHNQAVPPLNTTGCSVTGGLVYRGCAMPELQGTYFFADFCSNRVYSLRYDGDTITELIDRTAELAPPPPQTLNVISSFGRDARGEIYMCDLTGWEVFKIVPAEPDDVNHDGVPDGCRCPADFNADGATNSTDISAFLTAWLAAVQGGPHADYNRDGVTNSTDISAFLTSWLAALAGGC